MAKPASCWMVGFERLSEVINRRKKNLHLKDALHMSEFLGDYPIHSKPDYQKIDKGEFGPFDEHGIPMVDYDKWYSENKVSEKSVKYGVHYTPVTIAHYAFGIFSNLNSNGADEQNKFVRLASWFVDHIHETKEGFGVWQHHFPMPVYHLQPPWVSAMAQGEGISVLLRAWQLTEDETYLRTAHLAFKSFEYHQRNGGVQNIDEDGNIWFEEYPSNPPGHVLNGFIFALLGLWEYYKVTGNTSAKNLWENGLLTLEKNIQKYDCGYWTIYDQYTKHVVGQKYHDLHVQQMKVLYELSGKGIFLKYYQAWSRYCRNPFNQLQRTIRPRIRKEYIKRNLKFLFSN